MNKKGFAQIGFLFIIVVILFFLFILPQLQTGDLVFDNIHSVEAKLIKDNSEYSEYQIDFWGYGLNANAGGCYSGSPLPIDFNIGTGMKAETNALNPDLPLDLPLGTYSTQTIFFFPYSRYTKSMF